MQFSYHTLGSTFRRFNAALKSRGLSLPLETSRNVWAQIVLGKNFSAAAAYTKAKNLVVAIPISDDSIRANLQSRSRTLTAQIATEIFVESVGDDIAELSKAMQELIEVVQMDPELCVIGVVADRSGLGLLDSTKPGYFPASNFGTVDLIEDEIVWLKNSSELAAATINALGGKSTKQFFDIFAANHRASSKKSDEVFGRYFADAIDPTCAAIVRSLLDEFDPVEMSDWYLDFDDMRDIVFDVFDQACDRKGSWLKPDGDLAEAVVDHITVRLRESMKWMAEQADIGDIEEAPAETLMQSAKLAMQKMLKAYLA